jgi:hypothetical protein
MKRLFPCILLLVGLTACAGVSAPGGGNCKRGVCIKVTVAEPVRMEEPVSVTISVTADKDISDLGISMLTYPPEVAVEGPQGWETGAKEGQVSKQGASWKMTAKANQQAVFTRKVRFPPEEGLYSITVGAYTPNTGYNSDTLTIRLTRAGGTVYLSGTSVPMTPRPLPTITPGPSPTFIPTPTRRPYP